MNGKTKNSGPYGNKHLPNLICCLFLYVCNFELLMSFPNMLTCPHLQSIHYLLLCLDFILHYRGRWTTKVYLGALDDPSAIRTQEDLREVTNHGRNVIWYASVRWKSMFPSRYICYGWSKGRHAQQKRINIRRLKFHWITGTPGHWILSCTMKF
jgi:hypothetical protein